MDLFILGTWVFFKGDAINPSHSNQNYPGSRLTSAQAVVKSIIQLPVKVPAPRYPWRHAWYDQALALLI